MSPEKISNRPLYILLAMFALLLVAAELAAWGLQEAGLLTDETRLQDALIKRHEKYLYTLHPGVHTNFKYRRKHFDVPVDINALGFRDPHMQREKKPGRFRIAALGDSTCFGWEVLEEDTYPRQLERLLNQNRKPDRGAVEVLNFGVPGYTSFSGKQLLDDVVWDFKPDMVLVGYGFNDWKFRTNDASDEQRLLRAEDAKDKSFYIRAILGTREFMRKSRLLGALDHSLHYRMLKQTQPADYAMYRHKVMPQEYEANIEQMVRSAKDHQTPIVLLNTNFLNDYTREILERIAAREHVPYFDLRALFERTLAPQSDLEAWTQAQLHLLPAGPFDTGKASDGSTVVFRFYVPLKNAAAVEKSGFYLFGDRDELGAWKSGAVAMHDDGKNGDEVAGDRVWSASVEFKNPSTSQTLQYAALPFGPTIVRPLHQGPIAEFRSFIYFHHDAWAAIAQGPGYRTAVHLDGYTNLNPLLLAGTDFVHPNAAGYAVVARALVPLVRLEELRPR